MKNTFLLFLLIGVLAFGAAQLTPVAHAYAEEATKKKDGGEGGKDKAPEGVVGGRFAGDPIFVHVQPMVLPVITDSGVEQLVTVIMDIQVKDFDSADDLHTNMPRVMDALMRALYGGLGQGTLRNGKLVDVAKVKQKAVAAIGEIIGPDKVADVLIQSVSQRML